MHFFLHANIEEKKQTTMQLLTYIDDVPLFVVRNMKFCKPLFS